jgi:hypothetical protein
MEVSGQLHVPTALPLVPIGKEAGWTPGSVLSGGEEKENPCPCRESNLGYQTRSLVAILTQLPRFHWVRSKEINIRDLSQSKV